MYYGNVYLQEITSIDTELKRIAAHTKSLRIQKEKKMEQLYYYMVENNIEKMGEGKAPMTQKKCMPKHLKPKAKPKDQKRDEALQIMKDAGIEDAEEIYSQIEEAHKEKNIPEGSTSNVEKPADNFEALGLDVVFSSSKKKRKGGKKDAYDPLLGF
jgi:hypothetical protein